MNTPKNFAKALAALDLPSVFNPYRDCCPVHDRADAPRVRTANLVRCLEAAIDADTDTIWIARDLGYRGGRRTGVPLTDDVHLPHAGSLFGGALLQRATKGPVMAERTATIVWDLLSRIGQPVMLWNIFPLHPHEASDPFSNRCHSSMERKAAWPFLEALIAMIQPRRIVAIGRDAGAALDEINLPLSMVRHPSYGGQAEFIAGIQAIYGLSDAGPADPAQMALPGAYAAGLPT